MVWDVRVKKRGNGLDHLRDSMVAHWIGGAQRKMWCRFHGFCFKESFYAFTTSVPWCFPLYKSMLRTTSVQFARTTWARERIARHTVIPSKDIPDVCCPRWGIGFVILGWAELNIGFAFPRWTQHPPYKEAYLHLPWT